MPSTSTPSTTAHTAISGQATPATYDDTIPRLVGDLQKLAEQEPVRANVLPRLSATWGVLFSSWIRPRRPHCFRS